jgi:hypothetical protein
MSQAQRIVQLVNPPQQTWSRSDDTTPLWRVEREGWGRYREHTQHTGHDASNVHRMK